MSHRGALSHAFWPSLIKRPPAVTLTSQVARWGPGALAALAAEGRTGRRASTVPRIHVVSFGFAGASAGALLITPCN